MAYQVARSAVTAFSHLWWRPSIEGRENIPALGPFILSAVHRSNIDTPLMVCVTRRRMHFMGKDTMWRYGWSAWLWNTLGGIPVNRDGADRRALRRCETALRRGEPVVIFPEGTRKSGPLVEGLYEGAAFISARTGAPIVPVGVSGSAEAMPVGSRWLHPVKVRIVVGKPIVPVRREGSGTRGSRRQVHVLTARLQVELQALFDQAEGRSS